MYFDHTAELAFNPQYDPHKRAAYQAPTSDQLSPEVQLQTLRQQQVQVEEKRRRLLQLEQLEQQDERIRKEMTGLQSRLSFHP